MLSRDNISTIINALILAELNVDEHIEWNQESRREYLGGIRLARGNVAKEQRRARKARKNLAMYKLAGRRPWDCGPFGDVLDSLTRHLGDGQRLRESSGFIEMSKLAEGMR